MPKKVKKDVAPTRMVDAHGRNVLMDENIVIFYKGWPSQWYMEAFVDENEREFNCCEQYMMFHKARLFGDEDCASDIMTSSSPAKQKNLGRMVSNFDADMWDQACDEVVYRGNLFKFSQNRELRALLLATGDRIIAEASPYDKIWGIGLSIDDWAAWNPKQWKGANRLGKALMRVRSQLKAGAEPPPEAGPALGTPPAG